MNNQVSGPQPDDIRKRAHPRVAVDLKTEFQVLKPKLKSEFLPKRVESMAKTLGTGGLMFTSNTHLPIGTKVDMKLYYYSITIEFVAEVVWTKEEEGFGTTEYYCGSRYSAISYDNLTHVENILKSHLTH
ncbi:MAG: PilZ domain-containing protein [Nitrospirae bacterium]|nr:PilZ domain-containing protein [Nitrospirota bacterium]